MHELRRDKEYILIKIIWAIIIAVFIPVAGSVAVLYRGYLNLRRNQIKMYRMERQPVFVTDNTQYIPQQRISSYRDVKVDVFVGMSPSQKIAARTKGVAYIVIGGGMLAIYIDIILKW